MFNLSAPTSGTFFLALVLGGIGIAAKLHYIPVLQPYAFWIVCAGLVVVMLGNIFKSL